MTARWRLVQIREVDVQADDEQMLGKWSMWKGRDSRGSKGRAVARTEGQGARDDGPKMQP